MNTTIVRNTEELHAALDAGLGPNQIDVQPGITEQARTDAFAEGFLEAHDSATDAMEAGALKERHRIVALREMVDGHQLQKFGPALQAAIDNGDSPETFALALQTSQRAH